jgi:ArsR family transcriptional regulator
MARVNQKKLERVLRALANSRRLRIIQELYPSSRITVTGLSERIRLSIRSTSKHLQILEKADLVSREQEGLRMYYFINPNLSDWQKKLLTILD